MPPLSAYFLNTLSTSAEFVMSPRITSISHAALSSSDASLGSSSSASLDTRLSASGNELEKLRDPLVSAQKQHASL